ncbi:DUF3047 domain-containing protein [Thalassococcus lentus]|uniref:DUF3047 domain-containing protein n=1 Tax=Thalassococcus lentus TaxID=1210524 RepID=A0ABT4XPK8_9RHOB|nr:DUF3047 domain-containing protein [Thalassococcus lentus]MDA7423888.1 DUF3047 domain-containing protein [Thalassococcus lentus]
MSFRLSTAVALCFSLAATAVSAGSVAFDRNWKKQGFSLFSGNSYGYGGNTLSVDSDGAVSLTYRALPQSFWPKHKAQWSWSVSEGVPATDLTRKGGDDRNLAMYFVFLPEAEAQRVQGGNIRQLLRSDNARVLVYVWGGAHKRGAVLPSPYLGARGKTVVLRPSGNGNANENVDLAKDFKRAFGGQAPALVGLAVSGDSDDTNSRIMASISGLRLN